MFPPFDLYLNTSLSNTLLYNFRRSKYWPYRVLLWKQLVENMLISSSSPLAAEDHTEYIGLTHESQWRRGIKVMMGNDYSSRRPRPASDPWGLCPSEWAWLMSTSSPISRGLNTPQLPFFSSPRGCAQRRMDLTRMGWTEGGNKSDVYSVPVFLSPPQQGSSSLGSVLRLTKIDISN